MEYYGLTKPETVFFALTHTGHATQKIIEKGHSELVPFGSAKTVLRSPSRVFLPLASQLVWLTPPVAQGLCRGSVLH